jgi:hypothetical protein
VDRADTSVAMTDQVSRGMWLLIICNLISSASSSTETSFGQILRLSADLAVGLILPGNAAL